jgi:hypothetical protein
MVIGNKFAVLPNSAILQFVAQRNSNGDENAAEELMQLRSSRPIRKAFGVCTHPHPRKSPLSTVKIDAFLNRT